MKNPVWKLNWKRAEVKLWISKRSRESIKSLLLSLIQFRASRNDRDARVYDSRLKQYENEIMDLKARYDAITFDATRRIEENEVADSDLHFN